jgi:hypothetical protein
MPPVGPTIAYLVCSTAPPSAAFLSVLSKSLFA